MSVFKRCSTCDREWSTRDEFLHDPEVVLVGYQSTFTVTEPGLFLFNHSCDSTIAIDADAFADMYGEEIRQSCEAHLDNHPEYCCKGMTGEDEPKACICKFSRTIVDTLRTMMDAEPQADRRRK